MITRFLAVYSDHLLLVLLLGVLIAFLLRRLSGRQVFFIFFTTAVSWALGLFIKANFWLPRPYLLSGRPPLINYLLDGSFPSNHALISFTLALSVWIFHKKLGGFFLFLSLLISAGRVMAQVHTPVDVFGGLLLSILLVYVARRLVWPRLRD